MLLSKRIGFLYIGLQLITCSLLLSSCNTIDLYEKQVPIPKHAWSASYKPSFTFDLTDTTAAYQLFIVLRHNDQYSYNNIWMNLSIKSPDGKTQKFSEIEMPLAARDKGWMGVGMDDLYEQRLGLTLDPSKFTFSQKGTYTFTLEQIMREDPLQHVMNVGIRLEKKHNTNG